MTVKELIEELEQVPEDTLVYYDSPVKGLETSGLTLEDFKVECLERGACTAAARTAGRR